MRFLLLLAVASTFLLSVPTYADSPPDAGPAVTAPASTPAAVPAAAPELESLKQAVTAAQAKKWFALAGAVLSLLLGVIRRAWLAKVKWLQTDRWGWFVGVVIPALLGVAGSLMTGPPGWGTVFDALLTAAFAVLTHSTWTNAVAPKDTGTVDVKLNLAVGPKV